MRSGIFGLRWSGVQIHPHYQLGLRMWYYDFKVPPRHCVSGIHFEWQFPQNYFDSVGVVGIQAALHFGDLF